MPAQGALPDESFGLIETLLFAAGGFVLLEEHLARLAASAQALGFAHDEGAAQVKLEALVANALAPRLRVRLVLGRDGMLAGEAVPLAPAPPNLVWRVTPARERFCSADPLLRHKTTLRARYEEPLAAAGTDEVIFLNERGEICEGARSNVFLESGGVLLTPPLSCGLLPGTLRAALLAEGRAREAVLTPADLGSGKLFMGNSVRGLVPARRVES